MDRPGILKGERTFQPLGALCSIRRRSLCLCRGWVAGGDHKAVVVPTSAAESDRVDFGHPSTRDANDGPVADRIVLLTPRHRHG